MIVLSCLRPCVEGSRIPVPSWTGCPVDGPLLPRPTNLAESTYVKDATANLTRALDSAIKGKIKAGFEVDNTSFSISLVSPYHEPSSRQQDGILWSYHHLGKNNVDGTKSINDDSLYLIGSVSKVFSDLLLLQSDVDLNDPITKYLPGLGTKNSPIQWNNITLSALSNHMAGIPANLREQHSKQIDSINKLTFLFQRLRLSFIRCGRFWSCWVSLRWPTRVIPLAVSVGLTVPAMNSVCFSHQNLQNRLTIHRNN